LMFICSHMQSWWLCSFAWGTSNTKFDLVPLVAPLCFLSV
jgi:hypothetical protein